MHDFCEGVFEDLIAIDEHMHQMIFGLFPESFEFCLEDESFVIESEHVGRGDGYFEDGHFEDAEGEPGGFLIEVV